MNTDPKDLESIKTFFNSYSKGFSSIYTEDDKPRNLFNKLMDKWFRKGVYRRYELSLLESSKDSINTILDVGCGPGHHTVAFLNQGKTVTSLDIAEDMINLTKDKVKKLPNSSDCSFIVGDYMAHNFETKFDAICVMGFFDYVSEPVSVLKKLLADSNKEIYISIPDESGLLGLQRKIRYKLKGCPLYSYSRSFLEQCLKDAGCFEISEIRDESRGYFVTIRKE